MQFDLNAIATALLAPVLVLVVKTMLEFSLAHKLVQWFWWMPVRGIFRTKYQNITGEWQQVWGSAGSVQYEDQLKRHSYATIRQFGKFCSAEFKSDNTTYRMFGKIQGSFIIGEWYDIESDLGYFGTFQLKILSNSSIKGKYIGHSQNTGTIGFDDWIWTRK
jgi:hypothetical protein